MNIFYLFSFIPLVLNTLAFWYEIRKKQEYGKRPIFLLFSSGIISSICILLLPFSFNNKHLNFSNTFFLYYFTGLLYFYALFFLELSIHYQRIEKSYLLDEFKRRLKTTIGISVILFVITFSPVLSSSLHWGLYSGKTIKNAGILIVFLFLIFIICSLANRSVFAYPKGVLREKKYPFKYFIVIYSVFGLVLLFQKDYKVPAKYYIYIVINFIYIWRVYQEYFFTKSIHLQDLVRKKEESQKKILEMINKVLVCAPSEEKKIITDTITSALSRAKEAVPLIEHQITGAVLFRRKGDVFQIQDSDMIFGYCTPLTEVREIKRMNEKQIENMLMKQKYSFSALSKGMEKNSFSFSEQAVQRMLRTGKPHEILSIPECYQGLQRFIGYYPIIINEEPAGFFIIFKGGYDKIFPAEEQEMLGLSENLATIISILEGKEVQREKNRLQGEMNIARNIQTAIVPKEIYLEGYTIACSMGTATEVGGDVYDVFSNGKGNYLAIGDVSGHGLPAGIMSLVYLTAFQTVLETAKLLNEDVTVSMLYDIVNNILCIVNKDRIGSDKFMTGNFFFEKNGTFFHAGTHEIALLYSEKRGIVRELSECTMGTAFLGLMKNVKSEESVGSFSMEEGDILVLYTDGAIEAKNKYSEQFGINRLKEIMMNSSGSGPDELIEKMKESIRRFSLEGDLSKNLGKHSDDITFVIIKRE